MSNTVLAMGLPKTGKTTFLAAFWDVVSSGEVSGSLKMAKTTGDMQYLNEIRLAWADCKPITRTGPASDKPVTMLLQDATALSASALAWTDMLGESFERQWTHRAWTRAYQALVEDAVGALLFIHPSGVKEAPLIVDALRATPRALLESVASHLRIESAAAVTAPKPTPYAALKVATQVQLVDLLQFVDQRRSGAYPLRLALVISAWDRVERAMPIEPNAWVEKALPLLHQFLSSNDDRFEPRVFGVSAQGGDYEGDAETLRKAHRASSRIKVVDGAKTTNDITAPVRWSLSATSS